VASIKFLVATLVSVTRTKRLAFFLDVLMGEREAEGEAEAEQFNLFISPFRLASLRPLFSFYNPRA